MLGIAQRLLHRDVGLCHRSGGLGLRGWVCSSVDLLGGRVGGGRVGGGAVGSGVHWSTARAHSEVG